MRGYVKPTMEGEIFAANEYIASECGDSGTSYKFTCDAGGGVYGSVYIESNGVEGLQTRRSGRTKADQIISTYGHGLFGGEYGYHACGATHIADATNAFYEGYYLPKGDENSAQNVIVWRGPYNNNTHCTTNLDMDNWEVARS